MSVVLKRVVTNHGLSTYLGICMTPDLCPNPKILASFSSSPVLTPVSTLNLVGTIGPAMWFSKDACTRPRSGVLAGSHNMGGCLQPNLSPVATLTRSIPHEGSISKAVLYCQSLLPSVGLLFQSRPWHSPNTASLWHMAPLEFVILALTSFPAAVEKGAIRYESHYHRGFMSAVGLFSLSLRSASSYRHDGLSLSVASCDFDSALAYPAYRSSV